MRESSCQKMIKQKAARDRVITVFPGPFTSSGTPYEELDFDQQVRDACQGNKVVTSGLKISKVIVLGNVAAGKTCLVNRFCHEVFDRDYKATIGVDFEVERFDILQVPFNLQIWDTAGQERFKCIAASYYRGAHAVVIVFDLMDLMSLHCCPQWLTDALKDNSNNPHIFLVGTKKDLCMESAYQAVEKHALGVAKNLNAEFWAVSSKTGENINSFYFRLASLAFNASVLREIEGPKHFKLGAELVRLNKDSDDFCEKRHRTKCQGCTS